MLTETQYLSLNYYPQDHVSSAWINIIAQRKWANGFKIRQFNSIFWMCLKIKLTTEFCNLTTHIQITILIL